jgi:hypothetical protein
MNFLVMKCSSVPCALHLLSFVMQKTKSEKSHKTASKIIAMQISFFHRGNEKTLNRICRIKVLLISFRKFNYVYMKFLATDPEARVRFPALTEKKKTLVGLERGALSLVSTN